MRSLIRPIDAYLPTLWTAVALGALSIVGSWAHAANLEEVTVTAPTEKIIGRDHGMPIREVTATAVIQYNPISLTTNSGRALLDSKVAEVARMLCQTSVAETEVSPGTCLQKAIDGAKSRLDAAAVQQKGQ